MTPPGTRSQLDHAAELASFFGVHLVPTADAELEAPPVRYYVMGSREGWRTAESWPPRSVPTVLPLAAEGRLGGEPGEAGTDRYDVDFGAGTGPLSRFGRSVVPVDYGDRAAADKLLQVYTAEPLTAPVEIAGQPLVQLFVAADAHDYLLIAYLEDVAPDGTVRVVTEGVLRACFRSVEPPPPGLVVDSVYRSCNRASAKPVVPGEVARLDIPLFPVAWSFGAGHSIRLAVAGADADNFPRVPAEGPVSLALHRGDSHPSHVVLPVVPA